MIRPYCSAAAFLLCLAAGAAHAQENPALSAPAAGAAGGVAAAPAPALAPKPAGLPPWFARELARLKIPADAVHAYARDAETGRELLEHNASSPARPASTIKLVTTLVGLEVLDADKPFRTDFYLIGKVRKPLQQGEFTGDLVVRGNGDPALDTAKLDALARRLVKRGVRVIKGDLVLDKSFYDFPRVEEPRFYAEVEAPLSAPPDPLIVNGKAVTVIVKPDLKTRSGTVTIEPPLPEVTLDNQIAFNGQPCNGAKQAMEITASGTAEQATVSVAGSYPLACGELRRGVSVLSASRYFASLFRQRYEAAGGSMEGETREGPVKIGVKMKPYESIISPPMKDIVFEVNKQSNNLWAQQIFLRVGAALTNKGASPARAGEAIGKWIEEKVPAAAPLVIDNGAGLSATERVSARGLVELLDHGAKATYAPAFFNSLSVLGKDGTAANRMRDNPAAGKVQVKTGTVSDVRALSGAIAAADGHRYHFAILVHHANAHLATGLIDRLVDAMFAGKIQVEPQGAGQR